MNLDKIVVRIRVFLMLFLLVLLTAGCGGDPPAEAAKAWYLAVSTGDVLEADALVCSSQQEAFRRELETNAMIVAFGNMLLGGSVQIEIDASKVEFTTVSRRDDFATVTARGELRGAVSGVIQSTNIDESWIMFLEEGEWKWCGHLGQSGTIDPVAGTGAQAQATSEMQDGSQAGPWNLIPLGFAKSENNRAWQREPGWVYLHTFFAVENVSGTFLQFGDRFNQLMVSSAEGYQYEGTSRSRSGLGGVVNFPAVIPPGFRVREAGNELLVFVFRVAENSSGYVVHVPGYGEYSLADVPQIHIYNDRLPFYPDDIGLDNALLRAAESLSIEFPASDTAPPALGVPSSLILAGEREIEVTTVKLDGTYGYDRILIELEYHNKNDGYGNRFRMGYALIGDDGVMITDFRSDKTGIVTGSREVGPGQIVTSEIAFATRRNVENYKLIVFGDTYAVIDLGTP